MKKIHSKRFYYGRKGYSYSCFRAAVGVAKRAMFLLQSEHPEMVFGIYDNGDYVIVSNHAYPFSKSVKES